MKPENLSDVAFKLSIDLGTQLQGSPELAGIDVAPVLMRILRFVRDQGTATPLEIAMAIRKDKGHVTRLVKELEAEALIALVPNPDDGRSKLVALTTKAEAIFAKVREAEARIIRHARAGISDDDFATFLAVANQLSDNLTRG